METMSVFSEVEFKFFSFGAPLTDKLGQRNNPTDWLPPQKWDNVTELDKLSGFQGIVSSFEQMPRE